MSRATFELKVARTELELALRLLGAADALVEANASDRVIAEVVSHALNRNAEANRALVAAHTLIHPNSSK